VRRETRPVLWRAIPNNEHKLISLMQSDGSVPEIGQDIQVTFDGENKLRIRKGQSINLTLHIVHLTNKIISLPWECLALNFVENFEFERTDILPKGTIILTKTKNIL
jgi:hypothetical protein